MLLDMGVRCMLCTILYNAIQFDFTYENIKFNWCTSIKLGAVCNIENKYISFLFSYNENKSTKSNLDSFLFAPIFVHLFSSFTFFFYFFCYSFVRSCRTAESFLELCTTRTCWTTASQTFINLENKLRSKRSQGEFIESPLKICERFSCPLSNNTFFSPIDTASLEDTYPPDVNCILKIEG